MKSPQADKLARIVDAFPKLTITVIGDMIADEFIYGEISRVSREAPVLILKHRERTVVPGGAANAVNNLADLGVNVQPVGVVGEDDPGRLLLRYFRKKRIPLSGILRVKGCPTITKTRILAGVSHGQRQQVVRIDREPGVAPDRRTSRELVFAAHRYARSSDAILISDYGYGAATPQIVEALRIRGDFRSIPVALDSRYRMLEFTGITTAAPNESEVEAAMGIVIESDEILGSAARTILSRLKLESLVITRGRDGMRVYPRSGDPADVPIHGSDQALDVTGAGDTVIAVYTASLAAGADPESAARIATCAAGVVVMKRGTATLDRAELLAAIHQ